MRVTERESRLRRSIVAGLAVVLVCGVLAVAGAGVVAAQEAAMTRNAADCTVTSLGTLGAGTNRVLQAEGRWTTEDCDSRFRAGSDAHTYSFKVRTPGRIRIELSSAEADGYLSLLNAGGDRIADNDDGAGLDARIERDLESGSYMIEATTLGGRGRGPADFTLTVGRVAGCDPTLLGALEPGVALTASGSWTLDTCGSRVGVEHPAHTYLFSVPSAGRVRIDLRSESGDPVLYFSSVDLPTRKGGDFATDDDSGGGGNARIERYLPAGLYFIEATTYLERDRQPLHADFALTVRLVDEAEQQQDFNLKVEQVHLPAEVVAGDPVTVHYRVGNAGGGDLPFGNATSLYVVGRAEGGRRSLDINPPIFQRWSAGVSFHSDAGVASATSVANPGVTPLEITFDASGPAWLFVGAWTKNEEDNEIGFHGSWHNLMVLSGPTIDPTDVHVDGTAYRVVAEPDDEGTVTTSVTAVAHPAAEVDEATRAKAIYAAGVRAQLLEGLFERPAVAALADAADPDAAPQATEVANPSTSSLLKAFGARYAGVVAASGLAEVVAGGEAVNPTALEDLTLALAESASTEYAYLAAAWESLADRPAGREALTFVEALALQSQLAYAEGVLAPAVNAGRVVTAAREATLGWGDPAVRAMASGLAICDPGPSALEGALEAAGVDGEAVIALDAELRAALPLWGQAADNALCRAGAVDDRTLRFLERLALRDSAELRELLVPPEPAPEPVPEPSTYRLRVIARLGEDGRVEFGAEPAGGARILPDVRYLRADAPAGAWRFTSEVQVGEDLVGTIRARRLADGRIEMGFAAGGEEILPDIRYLPAGLPEGLWFRSGEIEVTGRSG
jgi:hypothetical protein